VERFYGLGAATIVAQKGGEKGDGEDYMIVRYLSDHDIYIRLDGCYDSYSGVDFTGENYVEVEPKTVSMVVYNPRVVYDFSQLKAKILSTVTLTDFAKATTYKEKTVVDKITAAVGEIQEIERIGEQPEDGDLWYVVYYFPKHDIYVRIDGKYLGTGTIFSDNSVYEVKPVERKVTFYEP